MWETACRYCKSAFSRSRQQGMHNPGALTGQLTVTDGYEEAIVTEQRMTPWSGHHPANDRLRATVWAQLQDQGAAVGDPVGHIPRFVGADRAAARLAALPIWQQARVIKSNPDQAQAPVRLRALQDGK